jgi:hypothetical protein
MTAGCAEDLNDSIDAKAMSNAILLVLTIAVPVNQKTD